MSKFVLILITTIGINLIFSCEKSKIKMTVIKDCTGIYLRKNAQDYYVCNDDVIESYSSGEKIKVSYELLEQCFGILEPVSCEMDHPYESKIEVTNIF